MLALITGAFGGLGGEVARSLEAAGHQVIRLGRADADLSALRSVSQLIARLRSRQPIDLLINNAATAGRREMTIDGFEPAFAVNYLSHFLLTKALISPKARVVNVTSEAHRSASSIDPHQGLGGARSWLGWKEYAFSKACQVAFTIGLASRGVDAYSVHPGVVATGLWKPVPQPLRWMMTRRMAPPAVGAISIVRAALDRNLEPGTYVTPSGIVEPSSVASDARAIAQLWDHSERWVSPYLA
ncbi:MAG TPA: SDR family NAD(P)-dependent oxidoreductase [Acidimicrobiia bacterium]|nr:SDR family NAD(P)-dependent oxidoreductase [Acidimicrobiia bacterium]